MRLWYLALLFCSACSGPVVDPTCVALGDTPRLSDLSERMCAASAKTLRKVSATLEPAEPGSGLAGALNAVSAQDVTVLRLYLSDAGFAGYDATQSFASVSAATQRGMRVVLLSNQGTALISCEWLGTDNAPVCS